MLQIKGITSDVKQNQTLVLPDSSFIDFTIYFMPMQLCWVITNLTYGDFVLNGIQISNNPNLLYQFKNILPFGLACFSESDREPSLQNDFLSGASKLYILTQAEVEAYAELLSE